MVGSGMVRYIIAVSGVLLSLDQSVSQYANCSGESGRLNDGFCDSATNNLACGYDGGDCCACTCTDGPLHSCGSNGFSCADPACLDPAIVIQYPECAGNWLSIGDGLCTAENNNQACGYDGGDCCLCTCSGRACAYSDFNCLDPSAGDEIYDCKPPPPTSVTCSADSQSVWVVENTAQARALAEAVNCSGGSFEVLWKGDIVVDRTIYVFDGTFLNVTGAGSIASMDGNSENRLLTVVDAIVHVTGVNMSYGVGTVGGAIAAVRSNLTFSRSTFFGNTATGHGGAVYTSDSSVVSLGGHTSFSDNTAAMDGGAMFVLGSLCTGESVVFFNNTAGGNGGAMMITEHSSLSWSGNVTYLRNRAVKSAGALALQSSSISSWYSRAIFDSNIALQNAGALHVLGASHVLWNATTIFSNNFAGLSGGAMRVSNGSSASWSGITRYVRNGGFRGGAMTIFGGSAAFSGGNTTFSGNIAETWGGGVFASEYSSVAWDEEATFSNNVAGQGGAVYAKSNSDFFFNGRTTFRGNLAADLNRSDIEPSGGALAVLSSAVTLSGETIFADNQALFFGGAAILRNAIVLSTGRLSFLNNLGGKIGGALFLLGSSVVIDGSTTFRDNTAGFCGGLYAGESSNVSWDGYMEFVANLAGSGGAIVTENSNISWSGTTTFAHNHVYEASGGALLLSGGSRVSWRGETLFLNNSCVYLGGGVFLRASSVVIGDNTTFHGNYASVGGAVSAVQSSISGASWGGHVVFIHNAANISGGALAADNSSVSLSGKTTLAHNRAYEVDGGAVSASNGSSVSFSGETAFLYNSAGSSGGSLNVILSTVVFDRNTIFHGNAANRGGAVEAAESSSVLWVGDAEFANNIAISGGALAAVTSMFTWSGKATLAHNRAGEGGGGALLLARGSRVSWSGPSVFINNSAPGFGGAVYGTWDSKMHWSGNTTFLGCAAWWGGALFVMNGSAAEWSGRTEFISNKALLSGGAIGSFYLDEQHNVRTSTLGINGSTIFANNTAETTGGGLAMNGMLSVSFNSPDVVFVGNSAKVVGGAVFVSSSGIGPVFSAVRFTANFAGAGGGAYVSTSGNEDLRDFDILPVHATKFDGCQFVGNWATATGGAIETVSGQDHISNTLFMGNTAAVGGALRLGGRAFLGNCSFVDNKSDEGEGPAVDNIGLVGMMSNNSFISNVFNCPPGTFLDFNESGNVYDVACKGCRATCQGCTFEESLVVPICSQAMRYTTSTGGGTTMETLSINRGFWRATSTSEEVLTCYRDDVCLGGMTGSPDYCLNGYEGPYCSICSDGHATSFGDACDKCSDRAGGVVLTVVLAVCVLIGAAGIASYTMSMELQGGIRGTIGWLMQMIPLQSIKIVIVALQIVTQFTAIANVTYPHVYQRFLDTVNVLNFDLGWISQLSVGCLFDIGIHGRLLIATIGPIIVVMFLGVTYGVAAKCSRGSAEALLLTRHKHMSMMLLLTFLVYSSVSSILFQMFACDDLEDGKKYLRADYRVECDSSKHIAFQVYAGVMILLYTVGIPTLYTSLLFSNRWALKDKDGREESPHTQSFSDLWKPYKPSIFYYEVIECGRRVLLTGAVVFIYPNTSAQIAVTLIIAFVFAMISEGLAPFVSRWDTWVNRMGHVVVYVSMYVALLLKVDVSNERSSSQKVFEAVLVAAHLGMILTVIVEAGVTACSLRVTLREEILPRARGTT